MTQKTPNATINSPNATIDSLMVTNGWHKKPQILTKKPQIRKYINEVLIILVTIIGIILF